MIKITVKSFNDCQFQHIFFAFCSHLHYRFMLDLVYTFKKRIFYKITLFQRHTLTSAAFNFQITTVYDVYITRTHINCLSILYSTALFALAKHTIFLFQRSQLVQHRFAIRSEQGRVNRRKEKLYFSQRRQDSFGHVGNKININITLNPFHFIQSAKVKYEDIANLSTIHQFYEYMKQSSWILRVIKLFFKRIS